MGQVLHTNKNRQEEEINKALELFKSTELETLKDMFVNLSTMHYPLQTIDKTTFQKAFNLPEGFSERLFSFFRDIDKHNNDNQINFREFAVGVAMCCKGNIAEKIKFLFNLYATKNEEYIEKENFEIMVKTTLSSTSKIKKSFYVANTPRAPHSTEFTLNSVTSPSVAHKKLYLEDDSKEEIISSKRNPMPTDDSPSRVDNSPVPNNIEKLALSPKQKTPEISETVPRADSSNSSPDNSPKDDYNNKLTPIPEDDGIGAKHHPEKVTIVLENSTTSPRMHAKDNSPRTGRSGFTSFTDLHNRGGDEESEATPTPSNNSQEADAIVQNAYDRYAIKKEGRLYIDEFTDWAGRNSHVCDFFERLFGIGLILLEDKDTEFEKEIKQCNLKDFELLHNLGRGRYGRVRLARHIKSGKLFALKIMKKSIILEDKQSSAVRIEKKIHSTIEHRFICKLWTTFHDDKNLYMVLEPSKGGSLLQALHRVSKFDKETARYYAAQIVLALQYIHDKGIVYRDLKLDNVLLNDDGSHIQLTDFGFAKYLRKDELTYSFLGTPEYTAPEIIMGIGYDDAVDWWALGVMIYKMMCGTSPFAADSRKAIFDNILAFKPKDLVFPEHFDQQTQDIIKLLLKRTPSKRLGKTKKSEIKQHPWFENVDWLILGHGNKPLFKTCVDVDQNAFMLGQEGAPPRDEESDESPVPESYKLLFNDF